MALAGLTLLAALSVDAWRKGSLQEFLAAQVQSSAPVVHSVAIPRQVAEVTASKLLSPDQLLSAAYEENSVGAAAVQDPNRPWGEFQILSLVEQLGSDAMPSAVFCALATFTYPDSLKVGDTATLEVLVSPLVPEELVEPFIQDLVAGRATASTRYLDPEHRSAAEKYFARIRALGADLPVPQELEVISKRTVTAAFVSRWLNATATTPETQPLDEQGTRWAWQIEAKEGALPASSQVEIDFRAASDVNGESWVRSIGAVKGEIALLSPPPPAPTITETDVPALSFKHASDLQVVAVFLFGVILVGAILTMAMFLPHPSAFQYTVIRVILALSSAGVATALTGFLEIEISGLLKAGGALAVFGVVYFYAPAAISQE